jgi:hypothetical protein
MAAAGQMQELQEPKQAAGAHRAGVRGGAELAHGLRDQALHLPKVRAQDRQDVVLHACRPCCSVTVPLECL